MVDSALPCRRVYGFLDEAWIARFSTTLLLCADASRCNCQSTAATLTLPQRHGDAGHGLASAFILVDSVDRTWSAENSLSGRRLVWPVCRWKGKKKRNKGK